VRDYGITLVCDGTDKAFCKLIQLKSNPNYFVDESEMAELAFQLLGDTAVLSNQQLALETAKLLVTLFPNSSNAYEAYGEILAKVGKKEEAVSMLELSIALDPKNRDAMKTLHAIQRE
jgi:tetratricopeptide (TPR) repeat protein